MMDTSSVDGFLAEALRDLRAGKPFAWRTDFASDWQTVWSRIEFHGIPLILHEYADRLNTWPLPLLDRIAEEARLIVLWESTHRDAVANILEALNAAGIESVLMKGTALAYSFHDKPAARRRGDTDLLVRPENAARTREIFEKLGWYREKGPHGLYFQESWLLDTAGFFVHSIDLHWEPSDRAVLHSVLPIGEFFSQRKPIPRFGEGAFRPSIATMIMHAVTNQKWHAQHGYQAENGRLSSAKRLIWSVDFDLMVANMQDEDWDQLTSHCAREGAGPLVAEALRGAQQDLGTHLPAQPLAKLEQGQLNPDLHTYFTSRDSLTQFWLNLRRTRGLSNKAQLLMTRGLAPRDHLIKKYPAASGWPTFLLQGRLVIETAGRAIARVAQGRSGHGGR